jgi:hypothetical protein
MNLLNLVLLVVVVLIVVTILSRLMERQESSIVVDDKVRVALLEDGCEVAVPHSFKYNKPGRYHLPGIGVRTVVQVVERPKSFGLLGPGAESPMHQMPLIEFGQELTRPIFDVARVGSDLVLSPEDLQQDISRFRSDVGQLTQDVKQFAQQEFDSAPLAPLNIIQL